MFSSVACKIGKQLHGPFQAQFPRIRTKRSKLKKDSSHRHEMLWVLKKAASWGKAWFRRKLWNMRLVTVRPSCKLVMLWENTNALSVKNKPRCIFHPHRSLHICRFQATTTHRQGSSFQGSSKHLFSEVSHIVETWMRATSKLLSNTLRPTTSKLLIVPFYPFEANY